jgi:hypothetical protein
VGLKVGLDGSWIACVGSQTGYAMWPATLVYDVEGLLSLMPDPPVCTHVAASTTRRVWCVICLSTQPLVTYSVCLIVRGCVDKHIIHHVLSTVVIIVNYGCMHASIVHYSTTVDNTKSSSFQSKRRHLAGARRIGRGRPDSKLESKRQRGRPLWLSASWAETSAST